MVDVAVLGLALMAALPVVVMLLYASRVRKVGPNEVLVLYGLATRNRETGEIERSHFVTSGRVFVWPFLQQTGRLSLEIMSVPIRAVNVSTHSGAPVTVEGVAHIKIKNEPAALKLAAERFLSKSPAEITTLAQHTLDAHVRTLASETSSDDLASARGQFADRVRAAYAADLARMGLMIDALVIQHVRRGELPP